MIIWITLGLSLIAVGVALTAALFGPHTTRLLNMMRGALATVYVIGYVWLLFTDVDRGEWSEVMSGVGLVSWPVVWIYPAWFTYTQRHNVKIDDL